MIPVASIAIVIIVIYLFFAYGKNVENLLVHLFALNLVYEGLINVGYFVTYAGQTFKVPDFLQFVCVIISAIVIFHSGVKSGLIVFILAIIASVASLLVNPFNEMVRTFNGVDFVNNVKYMHYPSFDLQTVKTSLRLICFGVNAYTVGAIITYEDWNKIKDAYFFGGLLIIIYTWIEFILKNILHVSWTETFIRNVFESDTSIMTSLVRNGLRVVIGLNNEPSQFCMMMFGYYVIYIITKTYKTQTFVKRAVTLSGLILMVLCTSFRVVGLLPIILILYLITSKSSRAFLAVVVVVSGALIIMYETGALDYYLLRGGRTVQYLDTLDTSIGGGEASRLNTIVEAMKVFIRRPLLGIGPGQTFCYGYIPCALVMIGVFGLGSWYVLMFGTIGEIGNSLRLNRDCVFILIVLSVAWIYNDTISIGYDIRVIAIALALRFYNHEKSRKTEIERPRCIYLKY